MAGIKDVAEKAGVSISTVSNVINKRKYVSAELESKVWAAIEALNYEANPVGRGLKSNKTNKIGVIVPSFSQVYFPAILQGIHQASIKEGYTVSVYETDGNIKEEKRYINLLKNSWVDGIILVSYADIDDSEDYEYVESLGALETAKKRIPVVTLESTLGDVLDSVIVDNKKAASIATEHLLELGRKDILHISAPRKFNIGKMRIKGYSEALESAGISVDPMMICEGDFSPISGYKCMKSFLEAKIRFDGVFAANDQMAIGAIRALLDAGIRIPEDVAVVGLDNDFPSSLIKPSLSSVNFPKFDMGYQAVKLLSKKIQNPRKGRKVFVLDVNLVIRQSTDRNISDQWNLVGW